MGTLLLSLSGEDAKVQEAIDFITYEGITLEEYKIEDDHYIQEEVDA